MGKESNTGSVRERKRASRMGEGGTRREKETDTKFIVFIV